MALPTGHDKTVLGTCSIRQLPADTSYSALHKEPSAVTVTATAFTAVCLAAAQVAWGTIRRKDAPLVIGSNRPGKPRYLGDNSTVEQQCKPTRVLDGAGGTTAAASEPAAKRSAAQHAVFGFTQALLTAALACGAAAALLL